MGRTEAMKTDEHLYESQLNTLKILYKFRFASAQLVADYRGVKRSAANTALLTLLKQKYIDRRYTSNHKIRGDDARYFLTTKGVKYLNSKFTLSESAINAIYKNRIVGEEFMTHNLAVFKTYLTINKQYAGKFTLLTKTELAVPKFEHYPEQLPDLFLSATVGDTDYMLDIFLDKPFFVIKKRIKYYLEHRNEEWSQSYPYPSILLVCPDARTEAKVIQYTESQLEDFDFLITTAKALLEVATKEIWTNPVEPEKLLTIS